MRSFATFYHVDVVIKLGESWCGEKQQDNISDGRTKRTTAAALILPSAPWRTMRAIMLCCLAWKPCMWLTARCASLWMRTQKDNVAQDTHNYVSLCLTVVFRPPADKYELAYCANESNIPMALLKSSTKATFDPQKLRIHFQTNYGRCITGIRYANECILCAALKALLTVLDHYC